MNEHFDPIIKILSGSVGAAVGYTVGGWTLLIQVLLVFVIADWITGWVAAWMNGELRSRIGHEGIIRKVTIFILVAIANLIDGILGEGHYIRD
ncbi:holin, partial [Clostridium perfringens]